MTGTIIPPEAAGFKSCGIVEKNVDGGRTISYYMSILSYSYISGVLIDVE